MLISDPSRVLLRDRAISRFYNFNILHTEITIGLRSG